MMNIDYKLIGEKIKSERKRAGLTQEQLSEKLDVTVGYISQLERGITRISLDTLAKIATILECDVSSFLVNTAINHSNYLSDEINERIKSLTPRQKKLLINVLDSIIEYNNN